MVILRELRIPVKTVKKLSESVLDEVLYEKKYDMEVAKEWTKNISDKIKKLLQKQVFHEHSLDYKLIVQTYIVEKSGQSLCIANRNIWDTTNDFFISTSYHSNNLAGIVLIHAIRVTN